MPPEPALLPGAAAPAGRPPARPNQRGPVPPPLGLPSLTDPGLSDEDMVRRLQAYLRRDLAHAIEMWMRDRHNMRRPPVVASGILAMICDLHAAQQPFPQRSHVAAVVGCTIYGVDVALNTALTRGDIVLESRLAPGFIAARESVRRQRHYVPCHELLSLAHAQALRRAG